MFSIYISGAEFYVPPVGISLRLDLVIGEILMTELLIHHLPDLGAQRFRGQLYEERLQQLNIESNPYFIGKQISTTTHS